MIELFLLLSLFHKKPATFIASPDGCDVSGKLYFYTGDNRLTGISEASCEGAKDDWRSAHIDTVRMSRA